MLPSGSRNQTLRISSKVATSSFHSIPSISKVSNVTPACRNASISRSNSSGLSSNDMDVALFVPAKLDSYTKNAPLPAW